MHGILRTPTPSRRRSLQVVDDPIFSIDRLFSGAQRVLHGILRITERDGQLSSDDAAIQVRSRTVLGGQEYHVVVVTSGLLTYVSFNYILR